MKVSSEEVWPSQIYWSWSRRLGLQDVFKTFSPREMFAGQGLSGTPTCQIFTIIVESNFFLDEFKLISLKSFLKRCLKTDLKIWRTSSPLSIAFEVKQIIIYN